MELVHLSTEEGIATITIDNPPVNVLSREVARQLDAKIEAIEKDASVFAVIVTGAGKKAFMAGGDIKEFPQYIDEGIAEEAALEFDEILTRLGLLPVPVIAALQGHALGGGCELALACDFRFAEPGCLIGQPEITLGVLPGAGGTQRLPRLIGFSRAKRLVLTGEPISAETALRWGLVDEVVGTGEVLSEARKFAKVFTTKSKVALRLAKQALVEGIEQSLAEGLRLEAKLFGDALASDDAKEGIAAFMEKRAPRFTGQ